MTVNIVVIVGLILAVGFVVYSYLKYHEKERMVLTNKFYDTINRQGNKKETNLTVDQKLEILKKVFGTF